MSHIKYDCGGRSISNCRDLVGEFSAVMYVREDLRARGRSVDSW
jgi:hypothetical protein